MKSDLTGNNNRPTRTFDLVDKFKNFIIYCRAVQQTTQSLTFWRPMHRRQRRRGQESGPPCTLKRFTLPQNASKMRLVARLHPGVSGQFALGYFVLHLRDFVLGNFVHREFCPTIPPGSAGRGKARARKWEGLPQRLKCVDTHGQACSYVETRGRIILVRKLIKNLANSATNRYPLLLPRHCNFCVRRVAYR